jgi:hypothetical protein
LRKPTHIFRMTRGTTFRMAAVVPMQLLLKPLSAFIYPRCGGVSRAAKGADCKAA